MAGFGTKGSLRRKCTAEKLYTAEGKAVAPMRPGKTMEDKRIGAWGSKSERNARQAALREAGSIARK